MKTRLLRLTLVLLLAGAAVGEERPEMKNGKVVERPLTGSLAATIAGIASGGGTAWIGYAVPVVESRPSICCHNASEFRQNVRCCGGCKLEAKSDSNFIGRVNDCAPPDSDVFFVLVRVSGGRVERIRPVSIDCGLDLGGATLHWLGPVGGAESAGWLSGWVERVTAEDRAERRLGDSAFTTLALHRDPAADAALARYLAPERPRKVRQQAAFWLGSERGQRGFELVRDALRADPDPKFREEATFALSTSNVPEAEAELLRIARRDQDADVRGQALFWLAQKAGKKVAGPISEAIEHDPDTDVKKKAVFALSQMENDEGVPLLIQLAKTHKNPVVRKEALFWLGQSGDPRALDYIESILASK